MINTLLDQKKFWSSQKMCGPVQKPMCILKNRVVVKIIFILSERYQNLIANSKKIWSHCVNPRSDKVRTNFCTQSSFFMRGAINVLVHYLLLVLHYQQGALGYLCKHNDYRFVCKCIKSGPYFEISFIESVQEILQLILQGRQ